ncbi:hypothetical protein CHH79_03335 [Bacillus siamensis]|nr:hypothetical protein CHH79_03335 [Bacillus siamensis]
MEVSIELLYLARKEEMKTHKKPCVISRAFLSVSPLKELKAGWKKCSPSDKCSPSEGLLFFLFRVTRL